MEIGQNFTKWCKTLNSKANVNIFGEFWECTRGIGYFIPSKVPFLNAQSWALLVIFGLFWAVFFSLKTAKIEIQCEESFLKYETQLKVFCGSQD